MNEDTYTYWKRLAPGSPGDAISGYCPAKSVPDYGEVRGVPLPREISTTVDADGNLTAMSPPIIGSKLAYRYELQISKAQRIAIPGMSVSAAESMLNILVSEAPIFGADRQNWWWYAQDRFSYIGASQKPPVSLMTKWKRGMLEILLANHPDKDKHLMKWDCAVAAHKGAIGRKRSPTTKSNKKTDGDLVVLPRPIHFKEGTCKQVFRYSIEPASSFSRAKHFLKAQSTRYKTPHGPSMTFKDGKSPSPTISIPMRAALAILAWSEAPLSNAHEILAAEATFADQSREALADLQAWIKAEQDLSIYGNDIRAAHSALVDFPPERPTEGTSAKISHALRRIGDEYQYLRDLLAIHIPKD